MSKTIAGETVAAGEVCFVSDESTGFTNALDPLSLEFNYTSKKRVRIGKEGLTLLDRLSYRSTPFIIAQRGAPWIHAEESLIGFEYALNAGASIIKADVRASSDGVLYLMQSDTMTTETYGSGTLSGNTSITIDNERLRGWTVADQRICRLSDLLRLMTSYNALLILEDKVPSVANTAAILRKVAQSPLESTRILIASAAGAGGTDNFENLYYAKSLGYAVVPIWSETTNTTTATSYATIVTNLGAVMMITGFTLSYSQSVLNIYLATGAYVVTDTINFRYFRDLAVTAGLSGYCVNDYVYMSTSQRLYTSDRWALGWMPGMVPASETKDSTNRGQIESNGTWHMTPMAYNKVVLMGWSGPWTVAELTSTITIQAYFTITSRSGTSSYAKMFLSDVSMGDQTPLNSGVSTRNNYYIVGVRGNSILIQRIDNNAITQLTATTFTGKTHTIGVEYLFTLTIGRTASATTFTVTTTTDSSPSTVSISDTSASRKQPQYLSLSGGGGTLSSVLCATRWRNLSIVFN